MRLAAFLGAALSVWVVTGCGGSNTKEAAPPSLSKVHPQAHPKACPKGRTSQADFATFYSGSRFTKYPLKAVLRVCYRPPKRQSFAGAPRAAGANFKSYVYGTCKGTKTEPRCRPPVEVQVFPVCERNLGLYDKRITPYRRMRVRGVPAAYFPGFGHLELYTADATVVIWTASRSKQLALDVAQQLRSAPGYGQSFSAQGPLPTPVTGFRSGSISC